MSVNPQQLMSRAKDIITNPTGTWEQVRNEPTTVKDFYLNWIMIGAAIPPICMFLGNLLFGMKIPFTGVVVRLGLMDSLINGLVSYAFGLVGVYLFALILSKLAPKFDGRDDLVSSLKLVGYSMTPGWIAGALAIFGNTSLLMIGTLVSLYGFYLLYSGITTMTGVPNEKRMTYFIVSFLAVIVTSMVLGALTGGMMSHPVAPAVTYGGNGAQFDAQKFQQGMAESMQQLQKLAPPQSH